MDACVVFSAISDRQILGIMTHADLADYYDFLGLMGFKRLHEYRALKETVEMRGVHRYYIDHFNGLLEIPKTDFTSPIPAMWRTRTRFDVDRSAEPESVRAGMDAWREWEHSAKRAYEEAYESLCDMGEVAAARKACALVEDADREAKRADLMCIKLASVDYDLRVIVPMQDDIHAKYKAKTERLGVDIC